MTVRVVVVGSINMDLVVRCEMLPAPGETIRALSSTEVCGGKGANQAVAAAKAGAAVTMVGRVGTDAFAPNLIHNLKSVNGIDVRHVVPSPDSPSGLAIVAVEDSGENSILLVPGANDGVSVADIQNAHESIQQADVVLCQLEVPTPAVVAALGIAKAAGVRTILDPAPAPTEWLDAFAAFDVICPNEPEAAAISGLPVNGVEEAVVAARHIHEEIGCEVVITMGELGAVVHDENQGQHIPAVAADVVDTTGAGDAFAGALAVRFAETSDLVASVRFANAAGSLATTRLGAQSGMGDRSEIEQLL